MPDVMAVSFERYGRLYYLDPGGQRFAVGDKVLVPTDGGPEVAECVWAPEEIQGDPGDFAGLPVCAGPAQPADLQRDSANKRWRAEIRLTAKKLIKTHELPMKVVGVDFLDRETGVDRMVVVYFTAPHRVDFRALVGDLARVLKARIDLRQVGSRDAARVLGGIGSCGRDLCCATFLKDFEPVSLRLAKAQGVPPNPMRISGACGRLMCCLKYEHPLYAEFNRQAPRLGTPVETPLGDGVVVGHRPAADAVVVRMNESGAAMSCSRAGVCGSRTAYRSRDDASADADTADTADTVETAGPDAAQETQRRKPRTRRRRPAEGSSST